MIFLISAPPRTGKSLFAIKKIFEYLNDGRAVYTNILGINIDGVRTFTNTPDNPFDWRNFPNDSVIFYDEAQEHMSFGSKKIPRKYKDKEEEILDIGDSLSLHGHFGFDIFLISQKPNLLRSDILGFVSVHYVLRRKWGQNFATIWEFGEAITSWSKSSADSALNKTKWFYPKYLYKYYKSSESHNVKSTFPKKYLLVPLAVVLLFGKSIYSAYQTGFFGNFKKEEVAEVQPTEQRDFPVVQVQKDANVDEELLKLQAENMGITVQQLKDLKNPEIKNEEYARMHNEYNIQNPFDYSYLKGSTDRLFAGCIYSIKQGYKAYDNQGSVIDGVDPSVCQRVIQKGERPYRPKAQNYESQMANQNNSYENNENADKQDFQQDVEKFQANNQVQPHLQRPMNGSNDSSFSY